jgi:hypothetical protein
MDDLFYRSWKCTNNGSLSIEEINLSGNVLTDGNLVINATIFPKLTYLHLNKNLFTKIPPHLFQPIGTFVSRRSGRKHHFKKISLAENKIQSLQNIENIGYIDVELLNLSFNSIVSWNKSDVFVSNVHNISYVDLSYNAISMFHEVMLDSIGKINYVILDGNPIDCNDCTMIKLQKWIASNPKYKNLKCLFTPSLYGTHVIDVDFDASKCFKKTEFFGYFCGFVISIFAIILITTWFGYTYRFNLVYMLHVIRTKRHARNMNQQDFGQWNYDAFVSYCHKDRDWVYNCLVKKLESTEMNYTLCLHERDFSLGGYIIDNIGECIRTSRHVIFVLTPNFVASNVS